MLAGKITRTRQVLGKLAYEVLVAGNMQPVPASEQVSILRDLFLRGTKRIRGISLCHGDRAFSALDAVQTPRRVRLAEVVIGRVYVFASFPNNGINLLRLMIALLREFTRPLFVPDFYTRTYVGHAADALAQPTKKTMSIRLFGK